MPKSGDDDQVTFNDFLAGLPPHVIGRSPPVLTTMFKLPPEAELQLQSATPLSLSYRRTHRQSVPQLASPWQVLNTVGHQTAASRGPEHAIKVETRASSSPTSRTSHSPADPNWLPPTVLIYKSRMRTLENRFIQYSEWFSAEKRKNTWLWSSCALVSRKTGRDANHLALRCKSLIVLCSGLAFEI